MTLTIDLPDNLDSASRESDRTSWRHRLILRPSDLTIEVWTAYGNGTPMDIWHNRVIELASIPDGAADLSPVLGVLERHADEIQALADMHRVEWNGSDYAGAFGDSDRARDMIHDLREAIHEAAAECPQVWDADE